MLIDFTVENYRSFREQVSLRMEATSIKELRESVITKDDYKLLPVAVIYGANSSGKSNVLKTMAEMGHLVMTSSKMNPDESLHYEPFMLDTDSRNKPTSFEVQFLAGQAKYRYGFSYDKQHIISEYLFVVPFGKHTEKQLFIRAEDEYEISDKDFSEGIGLESKTLDNRLFLTVAAQFNGKISLQVMRWFSRFNAINGLERTGYEGMTLRMLTEHLKGSKEALQFFRDTQLGFKDIKVKQDLAPETYTIHNVQNDEGKVVKEEEFLESIMESEGSKKMIEISGPIFDSLLNGKILMIDELDAKLHPILTRRIVHLFTSPEVNKKGAQLIFNTHDTNLLNVRYFRRDQIWFTEKDKHDSTDLYSLVEFVDNDGRKVRNDSSFEKDYINGRYGAIPFLGGLSYGEK